MKMKIMIIIKIIKRKKIVVNFLLKENENEMKRKEKKIKKNFFLFIRNIFIYILLNYII
jgi:hypothetical protein